MNGRPEKLRAAVLPIVIFAGLPLVFLALERSGTLRWQNSALPYPYLTEIGVLVVLPLLARGVSSAPPTWATFYIDWRVLLGRDSIAVVSLTWAASMAFLLLGALGLSFSSLAGASILSFAFGAGGFIAVRIVRTRALENVPAMSGIAGVMLILAIGAIGTVLASGRSTFLFLLLGNVLLTALCEEFFFRGYLQGSLDQAWGRNWNAFGTKYGPGLFVASAAFGMFHWIPTTMMGNPTPWFWAMWTMVFGIAAGLLKNKSETLTLPWVMHGTLLGARALGSLQ